MTFDEWWLKLKPAECEELKEVFRECWEEAEQHWYQEGCDHGFERGLNFLYD